MAPRAAHNPVDLVSNDSLATMNLKVLKRIDSGVEQVLGKAGHVALYDYDKTGQQWAAKGIEGTLFLVKRLTQPTHQFFVLNKKSQDHYVEDVSEPFKFESTEAQGRSYLLYRNWRDEVIGMWFYEKPESQMIVDLLRQIAAKEVSPNEGLEPHPIAPKAVPSAASSSHPLLDAIRRKSDDDNAFWDKEKAGPPSGNRLLSINGTRQEAVPATTRASDFPSPASLPTASSSAEAAPLAKDRDSDGRSSNALEKLFGSHRGSASALASADAAKGTATAPSGGHPPFSSAEAEQTKSTTSTPQPKPRSGASTTTSMGTSYSTPAAVTMRAANEAATSSSTHLTTSGLLRPSFFSNSQMGNTPRESMDGKGAASSAISQTPPAASQDAFMKLFAPKGEAPPTQPEGSGNGQSSKPAPDARAAMKTAILTAVEESEDFIPIVLQKLASLGVLKHDL